MTSLYFPIMKIFLGRTEDMFVRWIHVRHRKVDLSVGLRLPILDTSLSITPAIDEISSLASIYHKSHAFITFTCLSVIKDGYYQSYARNVYNVRRNFGQL